MKTDQLITQLEMYSNAIVGFVLLQAITYSASFGTNEFFNCIVKTAKYLAWGLSVHFLLASVLACYAVLYIGRQIVALSAEHRRLLQRLCWAKCIVIALFSTIPLGVTVGYGVMDYPGKMDCKVALHTKKPG